MAQIYVQFFAEPTRACENARSGSFRRVLGGFYLGAVPNVNWEFISASKANTPSLKGGRPMNKFALTIATLATAMSPALAMSDNAVEVDANGDGVLSLEEVQAIWADVTAEDFAVMDANSDGSLDDEEIKAAENAGMMKSEG
jgi:EF hand